MSRLACHASRLLVVGVPAFLFAALLGCAVRNPPEVADAPPVELLPDAAPTPVTTVAETLPPAVVHEQHELAREPDRRVKGIEACKRAVEKIPRSQEVVRSRTVNLAGAPDSIIAGGNGKAVVAGDPKANGAQTGEGKPSEAKNSCR